MVCVLPRAAMSTLATAAALVAACGGGGGGGDGGLPVDARDSSPPPPPCDTPPMDEQCVSPGVPRPALCGNNVVDTCFIRITQCTWVRTGGERCDGTARPSCTDLGFLEGESSCSSDCQQLTLDCSACSTTSGACTTRPGFTMQGRLAASDPHVAVPGYVSTQANGAVAIFDGATFVAEVAVPDVASLVGVPQGWLVARNNPPRLTPLDRSGTLGTSVALPLGAVSPVMAYGPGGRVLVAWVHSTAGTTWEIHAAIVDTSGTIVVGETTLLTGVDTYHDVTTDGTSFFVGADGQLARVAVDGTFTVATGLPSESQHVDLSWHGTTGWYVASFGAVVRRFDAAGVAVAGTENVVGGGYDFTGDGDDLLFIGPGTAANPGLELVRMTPADVFTYGERFGVFPSNVVRAAKLERVGAQFAVAWNTPTLQLALVPSP